MALPLQSATRSALTCAGVFHWVEYWYGIARKFASHSLIVAREVRCANGPGEAFQGPGDRSHLVIIRSGGDRQEAGLGEAGGGAQAETRSRQQKIFDEPQA